MAKLVFIEAKGFFVVKGVIGLFCENCGMRWRYGERFCHHCGSKLDIPSCSKCGISIPMSEGLATSSWQDNMFCTYCGTKLPNMDDFLVDKEDLVWKGEFIPSWK